MTTIVARVEADLEAWAEETWAVVKPLATNLGLTVLSQIETAAEVFVTTGGNFADALASLMGSLPADVKAGEAIVANVLSATIVKTQAAATASTATPAQPAAS
jgi:hypothetical protein